MKPDQRQEKMAEKERRKNPAGTMKDGMQRAESGGLSELMRGLGWKGFLLVLVVLFIVFLIVSFL
ncbi:DUF6366 family protein [Salibacterium sp. K-3]